MFRLSFIFKNHIEISVFFENPYLKAGNANSQVEKHSLISRLLKPNHIKFLKTTGLDRDFTSVSRRGKLGFEEFIYVHSDGSSLTVWSGEGGMGHYLQAHKGPSSLLH